MLRARRRAPRSAFVACRSTLRDPHALAALAIITTVVPGTVWSELAPDRSALLLHVFDLDDEAAFIAHYKARYERPLHGDLRMSPLLSFAIVAHALSATHWRWLLAALSPAARARRAQDRVLALDFLYVDGMLVDAGARHPLREQHVLRGRAADGAVRLRRSAALAKFLLRGEVIE